MLECDSAGFKGQSHDKGAEKANSKKRSNTKSPLDILKTRLAKGEITLEQYGELKKAIDGS